MAMVPAPPVGAIGLLCSALALLLLLTGTSLLVYSTYLHWLHVKYAHLPGPRRSSFFLGHYSILKEFIETKELTLPDLLYEWYKEYGLLYCFTVWHRPLVVCLDSKTVKEVLTNSQHTKAWIEYCYIATMFGTRFSGRSLLTECDHGKWAKLRSLFNPAFQRKYLKGLMNVFNESADCLLDHLTKRADGSTAVCMLDKFNSITLDVIGKVGFGLDFNIIEDPDNPLPSSASLTLQGLQKTLITPWYSLIPTREACGFRNDVRRAVRLFRQIGRECIEERLRARSRGDDLPRDILTYILDASEAPRSGDRCLDIEEMIDEFVTFFIAGQETTGNFLAFTLQQICRYPEVLKKILKEQEEVFGDRPFVDYADLAKLEYMTLVMKETLRQYPPVSGGGRILAHEIQSCGYRIPKGTRLRYNHYVMGKMERYYDKPEEFRPERFKISEENSKPRHLYAYQPFSLGQRNCIGQNMAMIESQVILSKLLRRFRFDLVPGQRFVMKQYLTNKPIDGCKTYITVRE